MGGTISVRMAAQADAGELLKIYAPYVTDTAISFEYEIPTLEEFERRISSTLERYPYIVAVVESQIVGYAYASAFKPRAAYSWAVETTVYLRQDYRGKGVGKRLYLALEELLKRQNIINLNACISYTQDSDTRLDNTSPQFHERLGYSKVAHFTKCGFKFGKWYDMIWMQKMLGEHPENPAPMIPMSRLMDGANATV